MKLLTCFSGIAIRVFAPVICVLGMAFSAGTFARTCDLTSSAGFNQQIILPLSGTGLSTVGEDIPAGTVIYSNRMSSLTNVTGSVTAYCTPFDDTLVQRKIDPASTPSGSPVVSDGRSIYPTNISGIGVTFRMRGFPSGVPTMFPDVNGQVYPLGGDPLGGSGGGIILGVNPLNIVEFDLIKTGDINTSGTQQVLGSSFPSFMVSMNLSPADNANEQIIATVSFTGAVTFHTKTCQIAVPDIRVDLGLHPLSGFNAPGTTTDWKSFDITLQNCPPFYGYGVNYTSNDLGASVSASGGGGNKVALIFNSVNGVVESNPVLASIESGPDAAQGIGIEMTQQDDSTSIPMDGTSGFELQNLTTTDGGTYVIPLRARYVQYDSSIKAGVANGAVVFTITYQ